MSAQEFMQRVEQTGLVSEPLMAELRKRVAETHRKMRPEMLAKLLVDRGELTAAQARKLVADSVAATKSTPPPLPDPEPEPEEEEELRLATDDDDDIGLAPEVDLSDSSGGLGSGLPDDLLAEDDILGGALTEDDGTAGFKLVEDEDEDKAPTGGELTLEDDVVEEAILLEDDDDEVDAILKSATPTDKVEYVEPTKVLDDIMADPVADTPEQTVTLSRKKSFSEIIRGLFPSGRGPRKKRWDSPLILIGGAAVVLLLAAGVGLFGLLRGESASEVFDAGMSAYESQSYGAAIKSFEKLNRQFSEHEKASLSRVLIGMSELRQTTDASSPNWETALTQATTILPTIQEEAGFTEVRPQLAKLLPDISAGLVATSRGAASTAEKQRILDLAVDSLTMVNNPVYLPTSVRSTQEIRIGDIETNINLVRRDIERDLALAEAIKQINAASGSGDITQAYALRDKLVADFPLLLDDTALGDALSSVTAKERDAVQVGSSDLKPSIDDHPPASRVRVVLSDQRGGKADGVDGQVVGVLIRGAIYGLRVSDGQTLWRRHVGFDTNVFPTTINDGGNNDMLIVDGARSELQRIDSKTGKLVWRLPCPRPVGSPRISAGRAFVCCGTGTDPRLLSVDLANGNVNQEVRFPVGCSVPPTIIESRNELVQPGMHSSIYVLDVETLKCKSVFASPHIRGSVVVPATWVGTSLILAENNGTRASKLSTFTPLAGSNESSGDSGKPAWIRSGSPLALSGQVINPPLVDDRRIVVTTELGAIHVFESPIDGGGLREVAAITDSGEVLGPTYSHIDRGNVWVANRTFNRFELQSTRGELVSKWSRDRNDRFLNPLQKFGEYLIHVRRRTGMAGATVSAMPLGSADGGPIWQTDLGVPSSVVVNSAGGIHAVTKNGAIFPINSKAVSAGLTGDRSDRIDPRLLPTSFDQQIAISDDAEVFASPPPLKHVVVVDLKSGKLERIPLRIEGDTVSSELVNINGSLLAPSASGPIYLVDGKTGQQRTAAFMPRTAPRSDIQWLAPTPLGKTQFVAAEKSGNIYRVGIAAKQLKLAQEARLESPLVAGLASAGNIIYAVVQEGGADQVTAIDGEQLTVVGQTPLKSGLSWGPKQVGPLVIVTDRNNTAYAFDNSGKLRWQLDNAPGPLSGTPLLTGNKLVFTSTNGEVAIIDGNGNQLAREQFAEPFGSGPVEYKGKLLVAGWDGTLFLVNVPK